MFIKLIKKSAVIIMLCCSLASFLPLPTSAQVKFSDFLTNLDNAGKKATFQTVDSLPGGDVNVYFNTLISRIIAIAIGLTGTIFLILILYSGIQWMTAGGEEEKITKAKDRIKNGVIGLGLCLLAFGITAFVNNLVEKKFLKEPEVTAPIVVPGGSGLPCRTNLDCEDQAPNKFCNTKKSKCVQCVNDGDCSAVNIKCKDGVCMKNDGCSGQKKTACIAAGNQCNWVKFGNEFSDTNGTCQWAMDSACAEICESPKVCDRGNCEKECNLASDCSPAALNMYTCDPKEHICKVLGMW